MADYIERQAVVNVICEMHVGGQYAVKNALPNTYGADLREIIEEIDALPSADVQPVRHGKWIDGKRMGYDGVFVWHRECSECGYERKDDNIDNDTPYCPNCGARMLKYTGMDGEQNDIR